MPELPEVETIVRGLAPRLIGRRILAARILSKRVAPAPIPDLSGRAIRGLCRRGKFIVVELDGGRLTIHLGMTGRLLLGAEPGPYTRAVFDLDCGRLLYDDIRMFGRIEWGAARVDRIGPEPLELGVDQFVRRLRERKGSIKPLLLNQAFLGGLGNIYTDEALFRARIHPLTPAARLGRSRAARLHAAIVEVLTLGIRHRGSSVSDYVDSEGRRGEFQRLHQVYQREGEPCPRCGSAIRRIVVAQRGTHYCPRCQKK